MPAGSYVKRMPWGQQKPLLGYQLDRSSPFAQGLVGCWLFNEGSGAIAGDLSSSNANIAIGAGLVRPGRYGHEIYYNYTGPADSYTVAPFNFTTGNFSIVLKIKCSTLSAYACGNRNGGTGYNLTSLNATGKLRMTFYNVADYDMSTLAPSQTTYNDITFIRNKTSGLFCCNGLTESFAVGNVISSTGSFKIASSTYTGAFVYCYVFNRALSAAEVSALYSEPYLMVEGWNYGRVYSVPSGAFINSSYWYYNPVLEAI